MDARRRQLVHLLERRRRRVRLILACAVTALACGIVAGLAGPQLLIGGVSKAGPTPTAVESPRRPTPPVASPLSLSDELALDPREAQANARRWPTLSLADRRVFLDRYWELAETDVQERRELLDRYNSFRRLPADRQEFLRIRARKLKGFMASLSPQDQAVLESMGEVERAKRLLELWQARYGTW